MLDSHFLAQPRNVLPISSLITFLLLQIDMGLVNQTEGPISNNIEKRLAGLAESVHHEVFDEVPEVVAACVREAA